MAGYKEISLSNSDQWVKVDAEDYARISKYSWNLNARGYPRGSRRVNGKIYTMQMHREIMNCPKDMEVDHINQDKLDNRKANLRICTHKQNTYNRKINKNNTSGYKGVAKIRNKFQVSINCKVIGWFDDSIAAARAYDLAAKDLHGEFAVLNFPESH